MMGPKTTTMETGGRIHQSRDFSSICENPRELRPEMEISLIFRYLPPVTWFFRSSIILPGVLLSKQLLNVAELLKT